MSQHTFTCVAGTIFLLVAAFHALRLLLGWDAVIGGWPVPRWVSWLALALAGWLAWAAFRLKRKEGE